MRLAKAGAGHDPRGRRSLRPRSRPVGRCRRQALRSRGRCRRGHLAPRACGNRPWHRGARTRRCLARSGCSDPACRSIAVVAMRVLIAKLSSFGDVIHTFPALTDLKAARPEIEVDWLVEEAYAPLV